MWLHWNGIRKWQNRTDRKEDRINRNWKLHCHLPAFSFGADRSKKLRLNWSSVLCSKTNLVLLDFWHWLNRESEGWRRTCKVWGWILEWPALLKQKVNINHPLINFLHSKRDDNNIYHNFLGSCNRILKMLTLSKASFRIPVCLLLLYYLLCLKRYLSICCWDFMSRHPAFT